MTPSDISRAVVAARTRAGLTQDELGEASGVHGETISRIERGKYEPAVSTLVAIAYALGLSLDDLVRGEQAKADVRAPSPVVRRLHERIGRLSVASQRALLAVAEALPGRER